MNKVIALLSIFLLIPQSIFANNYIFDIETSAPHESSQNTIKPPTEVLLIEKIKDIFLSGEEGQKLLHQYFHKNTDNKSISFSGYLTRDIALFLILQNIGINLTPSDIDAHFKNFNDITADSFFAPYIAFAKKHGITEGFDEKLFFPKDYINYHDFIKILEKISKNQEENAIFHSAPVSQNKIFLNNIYPLVKEVHRFDNTSLYTFDSSIISLSIDENHEAYFEIPENIHEYSLFFDHKNIPFLAKNFHKTDLTEIEAQIFHQVNQYRKNHTISSVTKNEILTKTAQEYAQYMFEKNFFEHKDLNNENAGDRVLKNGYDYYIILENLGRGHINTNSIMSDWMNSPNHNKNLINPMVSEMGFGFYGNYWVQIFGTKMP